MFDRFTDRSRKVMAFSRQEAERFNHDYIGTEHILLGLIKEGSGVAATVLENLEVDLEGVRREIELLVKPGTGVIKDQLPFTARGKHVLEYAINEARAFDHDYVGTEHLLLGLIREEEGLAAKVLLNAGLKLEDVRCEVLHVFGLESKTPGPFSTKRFEVEPAEPALPRNITGIEIYAHKAMQAAKSEALAEGSNVVLSEHILLGLLQVPNGLAAKILSKHGLELDAVRAGILKLRAESPDCN